MMGMWWAVLAVLCWEPAAGIKCYITVKTGGRKTMDVTLIKASDRISNADCGICTTDFDGKKAAYSCKTKEHTCETEAKARLPFGTLFPWNPREGAWMCCASPLCNAQFLSRHRAIACFTGDPLLGYTLNVKSTRPKAPTLEHLFGVTPGSAGLPCTVCWATERGARGCDFGDLAQLRAYYNTTRGRFDARGQNVTLCATNACNAPPADTHAQVPVYGAAFRPALPLALLTVALFLV